MPGRDHTCSMCMSPRWSKIHRGDCTNSFMSLRLLQNSVPNCHVCWRRKKRKNNDRQSWWRILSLLKTETALGVEWSHFASTFEVKIEMY